MNTEFLVHLINPMQLVLLVFGVLYILIYLTQRFPKFNKIATPTRVALGYIVFLILIASLKTFLQYHVWANDAFAKLLLPPHQSFSYFALYSATHFWFKAFLSVLSAGLLYVTLRSYVKFRGVQISNDHLLIGFLSAMLVTWPRFVFFVPLTLLIAVLLTIGNMLIRKKNEVPLHFAFVLGMLVTLAYGTSVIDAIGLSVLRV